MKQAREIVFADELRELVVGAVIGSRQGRERSGVQTGSIADGRHQLSGTIDQQRAERFGLAQKALQGFSYGGEVVLSERPVGRAGGHRRPVTVPPRAVSASSLRACGESDEVPRRHTRAGAERWSQSAWRADTRAPQRAAGRGGKRDCGGSYAASGSRTAFQPPPHREIPPPRSSRAVCS